MNVTGKADKIDLLDFKTPQMRAFHMAWLSFFLCFFGWFGIAPLLTVVREDLHLSTDMIVTTNMVAIASTILMRPVIGAICDRFGPRLTYTWLLLLCSLPVMLIGLSPSYEVFLVMRMAIGAIGASFVVTQYHTSTMFAPNCIGTANAMSAGWGNLGGGVAQITMPVLFVGLLAVLGDKFLAWRLAMVIPGAVLALTAVAYYRFTQDAPAGNFNALCTRDLGRFSEDGGGRFAEACRDYRVWVLFVAYGACFGVELLVQSKAALYFVDYFSMDLAMAGVIAGVYGCMNIFSRPFGGWVGDRFGRKWGLGGRATWLFVALCCEGMALMLFSRVSTTALIIPTLILFALFVQMASGATYSVVPFINRRALGAVAGIVGAGGNVGGVTAMFLFKKHLTGLEWPQAFLIIGVIVTACSFLPLLVAASPSQSGRDRSELVSTLPGELGEEAELVATG